MDMIIVIHVKKKKKKKPMEPSGYSHFHWTLQYHVSFSPFRGCWLEVWSFLSSESSFLRSHSSQTTTTAVINLGIGYC